MIPFSEFLTMLLLQHQAVLYTLVDGLQVVVKLLVVVKLKGLLNIKKNIQGNGFLMVIWSVHEGLTGQLKWTTRYIFLADGTQRKFLFIFIRSKIDNNLLRFIEIWEQTGAVLWQGIILNNSDDYEFDKKQYGEILRINQISDCK